MAFRFAPHTNNFIKNVVFGDCGTPWYIYVETFFPAFLKLVITQNIVQWDDVVRAIASEKGGAHLRRGVRRGKHGRLDLINNQVEEKEKFARKGLRTLITITEPLEHAGYLLLLYFSADRFYYDWQTLIERRGPCSNPPEFRPFQRSRGTGSNLPILPGGAACTLPTLDQNDPAYANNSFSTSLPPGTYQAFWNANVRGPSGGISAARASLRLTGSPFTPTILGEATDIQAGQDACLGMEAAFTILPPGGSCGWELTGPAVPVGLFCTGARVIIVRS